MDEKLKIKVEVASQKQFDEGPFIFDGKVADLIANFQSIIDGIPEEWRSSAEFEIDSVSGYEESHYPQISVWYYRDETDEEFNSRIAAENARRDAEQRRNADPEFQQYLTLKAKFTR